MVKMRDLRANSLILIFRTGVCACFVNYSNWRSGLCVDLKMRLGSEHKKMFFRGFYLYFSLLS